MKKDKNMKKHKTTKPLNVREIAMLRQCHERGTSTLADIAKRFRRAKDDVQANSWARNAVRRPLRLGLIKKSARGEYQITTKGGDLLGQFKTRNAA